MECIFPIYLEAPNGTLKDGNIAQYHICKNGIFLTKSIAGGCITVKVDCIPGMQEGKEYINILKRKIPMSAFWTIFEFFQYVEKENSGASLEAYIIVGYNPAKDKYILWVPEQNITQASVDYDISQFHKENPGCYIVLDAHSHGTSMSAFFSGTDDRDDNRDRFSMVFGKIDRPVPEYQLRFSTMGKHQEYDLGSIFETSSETVEMMPFEDAVKRVKKSTAVSVGFCYGQDWQYPLTDDSELMSQWENYYRKFESKTAAAKRREGITKAVNKQWPTKVDRAVISMFENEQDYLLRGA